MDDWQRKHIEESLPSLLQHTSCNKLLLAHLKASGVLGDIDVDAIEAHKTHYGKTDMLYKILVTRANSYVFLIEALNVTRQTGALKILLIPVKTIGDLKLSFLGKVNTLRNFLEDTQIESIHTWLTENISSEECFDALQIISKHQKPLNIVRDTIPKRHFLYFPRQLTRHLEISPDIFNQTTKDVFVFKNAQRVKLRKFITSYAIETSGNLLLKNKIAARFILLDIDSDWQRICDTVDVPTHLIQYEELTDTFIVEATSGGSDVLHKHIKFQDAYESISEDQLVEHLCTKTVRGICICDSPGMGKSLLLANIARKLNEKCDNSIVAFFHLRHFELPSNLNEDTFKLKSTLLASISTSVLAERILLELAKKNNLKFELFFDGFDEVQENLLPPVINFFQKVLTSLPQARVFVTSRPVLRARLENSLGVIAYNILPFNEKTQLIFMSSYWLQKEPSSCVKKLEEFGRFCLHKIQQMSTKDNQCIAGIPIQCRLIADVYGKLASVYADVNRKSTLNLYENFENSLSDVYYKFMVGQLGETKCKYSCLIKKDFAGIQCDTHCQVKSFHVWQALQLIFPDIAKQLSFQVANFDNLSSQQILAPGILETSLNKTGMFEFFHRTFAEFLVAEFLSKTIFTNSDSDKFGNNNYRHTIEQQAFECLMTHEETLEHQIGQNSYIYRTPREDVVAYFLNNMIENTDAYNAEYNYVTDMSLSNFCFYRALQICLYSNFEELLRIYLKCAANSDTKNCQVWDDDIKNIFCVAAAFGSAKTMNQLFQFFRKSLTLDISNRQELQKYMSVPVQIAVKRADYEVVSYLVDKVSVKNMRLLYYCLKRTRHLDNEQIEKRLDVAQLLLSRCPDLINEPIQYSDGSYKKNSLLAYDLHLNAIKFLVKNGALDKLTEEEKGTFFDEASFYMNEEDLLNLTDFLIVNCNAGNWLLELVDLICVKNMLHGIKKDPVGLRNKIRERMGVKISAESSADILASLLNLDFYEKHQKLFKDIYFRAIKQGPMVIVGMLLDFKNSLIEERENDLMRDIRRSPLLLAAESGNLDVFKYLVSRGANIFSVDSEGKTLLHLAAKSPCNNFFREVISILGEECVTTTKSEQNYLSSHQIIVNNGSAPQNLTDLFNWHDKVGSTPLHCVLSKYLELPLETLDLLLVCGKTSDVISQEATHVSLNSTDDDGSSPLYYAISYMHKLELVRHLVERGADWSVGFGDDTNVVHFCASLGLIEHQKYFLGLGCYINDVGPNGYPPFLDALYLGQSIEFLKFLVHQGADWSAKRDRTGETATHLCARKGLLKHLKYVVELGCDVNAVDNNGETCLFHAIVYRSNHVFGKGLVENDIDWSTEDNKRNFVEHLKYYVELGCDINLENNSGITPLHCAIRTCQTLEFVKHMVELGAKCSAKDKFGRYAVHFCVAEGLWEHLKYFVELGCDINVADQNGITPLFFALERGQTLDFVKYLVHLGADVTAKDNTGCDAIHFCAAYGLREHLKYFLEFGRDINLADQTGMTPLLCALEHRQTLEFVKLLIQLGADWTKKGNTGCHAVHFCVASGLLEHLKYFVEMGCDINLSDENGYTPLLCALSEKQSPELIKYLVTVGADWSARNNHGSNAVHVCASFGLSTYLKYFLELGCNVNMIDGDGDNALQCAVRDSNIADVLYEIIPLLMNAGVDKVNKNSKGKTAYDLAVEASHPAGILSLLM